MHSPATSRAQYSGPDVTTISDDDPEDLKDIPVMNQGSVDEMFDSCVLNSINVCESPFVPSSDVHDGEPA